MKLALILLMILAFVLQTIGMSKKDAKKAVAYLGYALTCLWLAIIVYQFTNIEL